MPDKNIAARATLADRSFVASSVSVRLNRREQTRASLLDEYHKLGEYQRDDMIAACRIIAEYEDVRSALAEYRRAQDSVFAAINAAISAEIESARLATPD